MRVAARSTRAGWPRGVAHARRAVTARSAARSTRSTSANGTVSGGAISRWGATCRYVSSRCSASRRWRARSHRRRVLAAGSSRRAVRPLDDTALAAGAAPGVADPVQPVAAHHFVAFPQSHGPNDDVMGHRSQYPCKPVERQCLSCGVVAYCDPALPCGVCNASPFHLIPRRSRAV